MRLCQINLLYFLGFFVVAFTGELLLYSNMLSPEEKRFIIREVGLGISILLGAGLAACVVILIACAMAFFRNKRWLDAIIRFAMAVVIVVLFRYAFFTFLVYANFYGTY